MPAMATNATATTTNRSKGMGSWMGKKLKAIAFYNFR
jgi:hypothetical protein